MASTTLYSSSDGRWFRVPDDLDLPSGPFVLRSLLGGKREVDEAAVADLQVDRSRAEAEIKAWLAENLGRADQVLDGLISGMKDKGASAALLEPLRKLVSGAEQAIAGDVDLTDPETRAKFFENVASKTRAPSDIKDKVQQWVNGALEDPERVEQLRKAADKLRQAADAFKEARPRPAEADNRPDVEAEEE